MSQLSPVLLPRRDVLGLYRRCLRAIPEVIKSYDLKESRGDIKPLVKNEFVKRRNMRDPLMVQFLLSKGELQLEQTLTNWKTKGEVIRFIHQRVEQDLFENFDGTEEERAILTKFVVQEPKSWDSYDRFL